MTNLVNFGPVLDQVLANTKTLLTRVSTLEQKMSEDFTGLNQAVADLQTEVASIGTEMDQLFAALMAAVGTHDQPAIDAAAAAVRAQIDALKAVGDRDQPPV